MAEVSSLGFLLDLALLPDKQVVAVTGGFSPSSPGKGAAGTPTEGSSHCHSYSSNVKAWLFQCPVCGTAAGNGMETSTGTECCSVHTSGSQ